MSNIQGWTSEKRRSHSFTSGTAKTILIYIIYVYMNFRWTLNTHISVHSHISEDKACSAPFRQRPGQQLQLLCDLIHRRSRDAVRLWKHCDGRAGVLLRPAHEELHESPAATEQIRLQEVLWEKGVTDTFCLTLTDMCRTQVLKNFFLTIYLWIWWRESSFLSLLNEILYGCLIFTPHFIDRFNR